MSKVVINAKTRTTTGKTAAKNLRKVGRIPAVVYNSKGEATMLDVDEVEFNKVWRTITPTTSISLNIDGKEVPALIKDAEYNIRTDKVLHADFFAPDADQKLVMTVKVHYLGTPAGVLKGGFKKERNNKIKIRACLADLPETVTADISKINVSEALRVKDLVLGNKVEVLTSSELPLVTVSPAR